MGFSPDGKQVVSGSDDRSIRVWGVESGKLMTRPFQGHNHSVTSIGFSFDGMRIISGSSDKIVRIWNASTGEPVGRPFQGHSDLVTSVRFSPDGKRVVSASYDRTVRIWDIATGELVSRPFEGYTNLSVAFSPDGKQIACGSYDYKIRILDAATGELLSRPLQGHTHSVTSVGFSPDGTRVVSSSFDKTIRIWHLQDTLKTTTSLPASTYPDNSQAPSSVPGFRYEDGWIVLTDSNVEPLQRLFWIPEQFYPNIMSPESLLLIGAENPLRIDIRGLSHGEKWIRCYQPLVPSPA